MNRIGKHWIRKADANRLSNSHRLGIHELLVNIERTFSRPPVVVNPLKPPTTGKINSA